VGVGLLGDHPAGTVEGTFRRSLPCTTPDATGRSKAVRDALGARPGDEIEFVPRGDTLVVEVRHRRSVLDFVGIAAMAAPHSKLDFADAYLAASALEVGPPAVASLDADLDTVGGIRHIST
jgi:predicted nucleic acid-binding protein